MLITGGSCGLGLALAEEFALQGTRLMLCAQDEQELERARQRLADQGAQVLAIPCDMTRREQVQHVTDQAAEQCRRIDILVNIERLSQLRGAYSEEEVHLMPAIHQSLSCGS